MTPLHHPHSINYLKSISPHPYEDVRDDVEPQ